MNIHHDPIFNTEAIIEHYEEKDGVPVTYVCTSDLRASDVPCDIFYRETPHPEFGNRYFGLYWDHSRGHLLITNADVIEELEFGFVENDNGEYEYSQSHHDYKTFNNGNMIDGGRVYIKSSNGADLYKVKNGKFIKDYGDDLADMVGNYVYPGSDCQT
jgi:hypothetical protein